MAKRDYDLILLGATGFTGQLVAEYLARQYGVGGDLRWAIAGRNAQKLEQVRAQILADNDESLDIVVADSNDRESLNTMAARATAICTTVGPYALYGTPLVEACIEAGTHYCDLTGEVQWIQRNIADFQTRAEKADARIVHTCGFDSIPSDLGTLFVQNAMFDATGAPGDRVCARVGKNSGAVSGGTVASMLNVMEEASRDPGLRKAIGDPYALYPTETPRGHDKPDQTGVKYDADFHQWTCPFVMAAINARVVRRSNALLGLPWGEDFRYSESLLCKSRGAALRTTAVMGAGMGAMAFTPTRALLSRFLPDPGEGPDKATREKGFFEMFFHAENADGHRQVKVTGDMDPGYGSTSKMLGEAAVCLALDSLDSPGGITTPTAAMGTVLIDRLTKNAGLTFEIVSGA